MRIDENRDNEESRSILALDICKRNESRPYLFRNAVQN